MLSIKYLLTVLRKNYLLNYMESSKLKQAGNKEIKCHINFSSFINSPLFFSNFYLQNEAKGLALAAMLDGIHLLLWAILQPENNQLKIFRKKKYTGFKNHFINNVLSFIIYKIICIFINPK